MTWYEALHTYFSSFGLTAYPSDNVPYEAELPFLTYERKIGENVEISVHLYYYTDSEVIPAAKAEAIASSIRCGGQQILYDGGCIWVTTASPEVVDASYDDDNNASDGKASLLKHKIINLTLDFPMLMR